MKLRILTSIAAAALTAAGLGGLYAHAATPAHAPDTAAGTAAGQVTNTSYSRSTVGTVGTKPSVQGSTRVINVTKYSNAAFVSPTGHIACQLDSYEGRTHVGCTFPDGPVLKTVPSTKKACQYLEFADLHGVEADDRFAPSWDCADEMDTDPRWQQGNTAVRWAADYGMPTVTWSARGTSWGRSAALPYGTTLVMGKVACSMHTTGVVCESLTTHKGFALNSHEVTPIGERFVTRG